MRIGRFVPGRAALVGLFLAIILAGCTRAETPAATLGPPLPPPTTPAPEPSNTPPQATATATAVQAAAMPTATDTPGPAMRPDEGLSLTVLHTNDVYGYVDPCG